MGYNMDNYPSLSNLNSEINEQANSGLSKLKSQLSYMNSLTSTIVSYIYGIRTMGDYLLVCNSDLNFSFEL